MDGSGEVQWNTEQQMVLDRLMGITERKEPELLHVSGPAASGKSLLLQRIAAVLRAAYQSEESVMVLAGTNTAADAIGGRTFHSALSLPREGPCQPLAEPQLEPLRNTRVVLIDNVNQVHRHLMSAASQRFQQAAGQDGGFFGGRHVIAFGDPDSWLLVPVPESQTALEASAPDILDSFNTIELDATYFADASFADAVSGLREGAVTEADELRYDNRRLCNLSPEERARFRDAARVIVSRAQMHEYNAAYRNQLGSGEDARTYPTGRGRFVSLWTGAPVVLTRTLSPAAVAGSQGVVGELQDGGVVVLFEGGASMMVAEDIKAGLPLALPCAYTLPTVLGLRFDKVVVVLPEKGWGELRFVYAAVSRAKGWGSLAFDDIVPEANVFFS